MNVTNFTTSPTYLRVKIIPKSPLNEIGEKMADETLKIRIAAPAEKGKANKELITFLANTWKIPKKNITIVSGHTSRLKLLKITPVIARQP